MAPMVRRALLEHLTETLGIGEVVNCRFHSEDRDAWRLSLTSGVVVIPRIQRRGDERRFVDALIGLGRDDLRLVRSNRRQPFATKELKTLERYLWVLASEAEELWQ